MRYLLLLSGMMLVGSASSQNLNDIPDQVTGKCGNFQNIDLSNHTDLNSEDIFWELHFLKPDILDPEPSWSINSSDYQFEMTFTASVIVKGYESGSPENLLALLDQNGNIRGVTSPTLVDGKWIYFLTGFSNQESEKLNLTFYDHDLQQVIPVQAEVIFESNSAIGDPIDPIKFDASIVTAEISNDMLNLNLVDPEFVGTEKVVVGLRTFSAPNIVSNDTIHLTVKDDYVPVITPIPDQIVSFDEQFQSFNLGDFIIKKDDDVSNITITGQVELTVNIDINKNITVLKPDGWSGSENISFSLTDDTENGFSSTQSVLFFGKGPDKAPEILPIEDQIAGIGGEFATIDLSNSINAENSDAIKWNYLFLTDSTNSTPTWSVNSNDFQYSMSVTATAESLGVELSGGEHIMAAFSSSSNLLVGVTQAIQIEDKWYYFLNINNNNSTDLIDFKIFDQNSKRVLPSKQSLSFDANKVVGDPIEPVNLEFGYLFLEISDNQLFTELLAESSEGIEMIGLVATDTTTSENLSDIDTIKFEILNIVPPVLAEIPDQLIQEGDEFESIDLSIYLEGVEFADVVWTFSGAEDLSLELDETILSLSTPGVDYFGSSTLTITATSLINENLSSFDEIELEVENVNDFPSFGDAISTTAFVGELYYQELEISDVDQDDLLITVDSLPDWLYFIQTEFGAILLGIPVIESEPVELKINVNDGTSTLSKIFLVGVSQILGLNEKQFQIYPNPTEDWLTVKSPKIIRDFTITDMKGQILSPYISHHGKIDLSPYPTGVYIIKFLIDGMTLTERIIKK